MSPGASQESVAAGIETIRALSEGIGPRPPASPEEAEAARYVASKLEELGLEASVEGFESARSFGPAYMVPFLLALVGSKLQRASPAQGLLPVRGAGHFLAGSALFIAWQESRFRRRGLLARLRRRQSRNVVASISPLGDVERTICLVCHLDSSRSGLMFHPRVTPLLSSLVAVAGVSTALQAASGPWSRIAGLRWTERLARAAVWVAVGLVAERELLGEDVPGANDNASGVGACMALAGSLADRPLDRTRVVTLFTGSEESGVLGMREFLARHDTSDWLFVNFDGVGADAPLRVLSREGGPLGSVNADGELLELAASVGREDPDLAARPLAHGSGLPYDSTPVLAGGGKAISVVNQGDGAIPDYHWPTDRMDRISLTAFERAVRFGLALARRIDRSD